MNYGLASRYLAQPSAADHIVLSGGQVSAGQIVVASGVGPIAAVTSMTSKEGGRMHFFSRKKALLPTSLAARGGLAASGDDVMVPTTEITVSMLRDDLPNLLARVSLLGESFTVMKHGKACAVITPVASDDGMGGNGALDLNSGSESKVVSSSA